LLLASIIIYLLATILVGFFAARKIHNTRDYMLAGRSLPLVISSSAMFATWFGSETVFGASSEFLDGGLYSVIEDPFGAVLCLLLFGIFFARKLYGMNLLTLGDYFKIRFGRETELMASLFLALPYLGYIAAQLVAMALILSVVTGMAVWHGVVISALVVTVYTYVGGMWAITLTDFIQTIIIIVGLLILCVMMASKAGGFVRVMSEVHPDTWRFLPEGKPAAVASWLAAWAVLGFGSIPSQDVFQRSMSSRSANVAVWSCLLAAVLYLTIAMFPLFIALCTKFLYPQFLEGDTQLALPMMVLQETNLPVQILFFGSLLSAIMSTTSSAILAPASIFSENLVKPLMKHRLRDNQLLLLTKGSVLLFSVLATIMACLRSNIYELVSESSILSLVSLFAPLTFGLYWKHSSPTGAMLSMVLGMFAWFIFEQFQSSWPSLIPGTIVSMIAMVVGSLLWPKKEKDDNDRIEPAE
jgi:solute:Na+ symporter, SSS family